MKQEEKSKAPEPVESGEMTEAEMDSLLLNLYDTRTWQAIERLVSAQDSVCIAGTASVDPFKDPTQLARMQGQRQGIYALKAYILNLLERKAEKENDRG